MVATSSSAGPKCTSPATCSRPSAGPISPRCASRRPALPKTLVKQFLAATFLTRTQAEWVAFFAEVECAFAPVLTMREAADDPQVRARRMIVEDERGWEHVGTPLKFREEPGQPDFTFPSLGQHTEEVVRDLGFDDTEIAAMRKSGVF